MQDPLIPETTNFFFVLKHHFCRYNFVVGFDLVVGREFEVNKCGEGRQHTIRRRGFAYMTGNGAAHWLGVYICSGRRDCT